MLHNVTPELRAVTLDLSDGIRVRFVYARRERPDMPPIDRAFALASFHRALLGNVTPDLRAVTLTIGDRVRVRFVYAGAVDDDRRDAVAAVQAQMLADLVPVVVDTTAESIPNGSIPTSESELYTFRRRD